MALDPETILQIAANFYALDVLPPGADYAGNEVKTGRDDARMGDLRRRIGCRDGQPDNQITFKSRITYIEWKAPGGGTISKAQKKRHAELRAAGAEVYVIRSIVSLRQIFLGLGIQLRFNARTAEIRDEEVLRLIEAARATKAAKRRETAALKEAADAEADAPLYAAPKRRFARKRAPRPTQRQLAAWGQRV